MLYFFKADKDIPFSVDTSYIAILETGQSPIGARASDASIHILLGAGYYPPSSPTRNGVGPRQHETDLWSR